MTTQFQPGNTYWTRSIVDADHIVRVTVASRTIKTDKGKVLRVYTYEGVKPWGSYSMCPIVGADRVEQVAA